PPRPLLIKTATLESLERNQPVPETSEAVFDTQNESVGMEPGVKVGSASAMDCTVKVWFWITFAGMLAGTLTVIEAWPFASAGAIGAAMEVVKAGEEGVSGTA